VFESFLQQVDLFFTAFNQQLYFSNLVILAFATLLGIMVGAIPD